MSTPTDLKFLIVDDFSTMRRIVRGLLKEMGCNNADEAEDGVVALNMLKARSSTSWCQRHQHAEHERLRAAQGDQEADESLKHLPVLMVTAEARKEDIVLAAQSVRGRLHREALHQGHAGRKGAEDHAEARCNRPEPAHQGAQEHEDGNRQHPVTLMPKAWPRAPAPPTRPRSSCSSGSITRLLHDTLTSSWA
jgi:two-component system chemotaxis response regulator CheY